ncbi:MAG TPA: tetratricopeptide repeat protein [Verrucomicrobiae bacterium]
MTTHPKIIRCALALLCPFLLSLSTTAKNPKPENIAPASKSFAPLPADHELASIWNDPDFHRRLIGSYGFASDIEPRTTPEEQAAYRDKVVPLLREDPAKAIPIVQNLAKPSSSALFDFTLGNIYFQTDDLTTAVKHFNAALAKFPDFRRAQKNLAFALVRSGNYAEAIQPLTRTVSLGGGDGKVFGLLGFAFLNQNRFVSAEAAYQQALVFEPKNLDFKLGLVKCSVATAKYDQALALLDELIAQAPERESLWTVHANVNIQKEQPAAAAISLEMLRRLGKATPREMYLLGDLYLAQEIQDLAINAYLEAIEKDGGQNPSKALRAAQVLVSRGAFDPASKLFKAIRAAGTLQESDELKLLKLESKVAMLSGEGSKAIQTLEQIIQKNPLDGEALLLAGDYYAKNDQREKAEFRYQTAATISATEADAYVKHAQMLVQSQKYPQAIDLLRRAQKVRPRDNVQRYLEKMEQIARAGRL